MSSPKMSHNLCRNLVVKLFDYAADHNGSVTVKGGAKYSGSPAGEVRRKLALLMWEGYIEYEGNGRFVIPDAENYRGRDPVLLEYIRKMKRPGRESSRSEPRAAAADVPRPGYPAWTEVSQALDFMSDNGRKCIVDIKDLAARFQAPLLDFMEKRGLMTGVNGGRAQYVRSDTGDNLHAGVIKWPDFLAASRPAA